MDKGAHFYRCDFQVHTPRDLSWKGKSYTETDDRKKYAGEFIRACRKKGLDAVAITDHHDLCFVKYIRDAAKNEKSPEGEPVSEEAQIVVYPGVELTLNVPCQAILILDADFPDTLLSQVLTVLAITPSPDTDANTAEVKRLDSISTLEELKSKLDEHDFLRNRYFILPNVTSGGSDTLLRDGVANKYKTMPCVGGYLDGSIDKSDEGDLNILDGKVEHYGNKRIALFQTSDSRSEDHKNLGQSSTWVKWAVPTAEALRQACLAQESRISQSEPELPSTIIRSVHVSNSEFMGPVDLLLNPQYTALIGSRGTGKSTILEYLRWALCDEHQNEDVGNDKSLSIKQRNLVESTLKKYDASVEVKFEVNGVPHLVRRKSQTGDVLLKIGDGELEECMPEDIRTLLPIQAYSQKQLSRVGVRVDELDRFVRAGIATELDTIGSEARTVVSKMRQVYSVVRRKQSIANSIREDRLNLESLTKQAKAIRGSLSGLSEEQQELISRQPLYLEADLLVQGWLQQATSLKDALIELRRQLGAIPNNIKDELKSLPEFTILESLHDLLANKSQELGQSIEEADATVKGIVSEDGTFLGEAGNLNEKWASAKKIYDSSYEEAKQAASSQEAQLTALSELDKKIKEISTRIDTASKEVESLRDPEKEFSELRDQWVGLHKTRGELYEQQCIKLTELSDGAIKATAHKGASTTRLEDLFKSSIKGSGLRAQKIEDIFSTVLESGDPVKTWGDILGELELLSYHESNGGDDEGEEKAIPDAPYLMSAGLSASDLVKLSQKFNPENWLEILLTPMEDKTTFDYQTKEGEYIPFEHASAGQQATALLFTLLNQFGPPLIIDQPEDDLDNQIIFEIVTRIWSAKTKRQILFSSHNANLVVNGDAELVVCCDYRIAGDYSRGKIANEGAIDIPEIRDSIKTVMEGGEKAFKLRLDKYGF